MNIIAKIHTDFPTKFGIPRQSGLAEALQAEIVFEPEYRDANAVRGLEGFSHIWLIWLISENAEEGWSPTVRPPRLGGNVRMGVFATRSPFRPNPIGLSSVKLEAVLQDPERGPVLRVSGADLMDGTPIYDIKPYVPLSDCHPEAVGGFSTKAAQHALQVVFPEALLETIPPEKREALLQVLAQDPRPSYQNDPDRLYGFAFCSADIRFTVAEGILTVRDVISI